MSNNRTGLRRERFVQSFSSNTNTKNVVYTTEDFVNTTVRNYLNTSSNVNIRLGNGASMSVVTGTTETVVTIGLCASLGNLRDVTLTPTPINGSVLQYNGTSWMVGAGLSLTNASITNLNDVNGPLQNNSVLFSSSDSQPLTFKEDRSVAIDNLNAVKSRGIVVRKNSTYPYEANIQTRFLHFPTTRSDSSTEFFTVTHPGSGITRKIEKRHIRAREFKDFNNDARDAVFNNPGGLCASNNPTGSFGLSYVGAGQFNFNDTNYLTGINGVLPISQGGTSADSSADARINLGLSYSPTTSGTCLIYDVMSFNSPSYRNIIEGDGMRLSGNFIAAGGPSNPGFSYAPTGAGYNPNTGYFITHSTTGLCYSVKVLQTGTNGGIQHITVPEVNQGVKAFYDTFTSPLFLSGGSVPVPGSSAKVRVIVKDSFITYGSNIRAQDKSYGLRFGTSYTRVYNGTSWEDINKPINIQDILNVRTGSGASPFYESGQMLIFNGTCFRPYKITGAIRISATGAATLGTSIFGLNNINFGFTPRPSSSDFANITGTTGKIQQQLDSKLSYTGPQLDGSPGQGILVLNSGTCVKTGLVKPSGIHYSDYPQIPISDPPSFTGISFKNVSQTFTGAGTLAPVTDSIYYERIVNTEEIGSKIPISTFLQDIIVPTGGLGNISTGELTLDIENLEPYQYKFTGPTHTALRNRGDFMAIGPSQGAGSGPQSNKKITISDLLNVPFMKDGTSGNALGTFNGTGALSFFTNQSGSCYLAISRGNGQWFGVPATIIFPPP